MHFDLATRIVTLGVGELAGFSLGPRESSGGFGGLWRAQLGQHWHSEHRHRAAEEPGARFEVPISGDYPHRGWTFRLSGRIDQYLPSPAGGVRLRELKTVTRPLPAPEADLQAEYPGYFVQLAAYLVLHALTPGAEPARGELVFIEASSGLVQTVAAPAASTAILHGQLDELVAFLDARRRAYDRRRALPVRPAFASFRPGQEHVQRDLRAALGLHPTTTASASIPAVESAAPPSGPRLPPAPSILCFEAPTGFGKTGCLLEFALTALKEGTYDRLVYLTGKSTGQLQVVRQLETMLAPTAPAPDSAAVPSDAVAKTGRLPVWQVRSKAEHCINSVYHCLPDACPFIADAAERWPGSGLPRFYLVDGEPRDLETLRAAGRAAKICPYEITRAALPFNDVWIGDYNYVFAPANRGLFFEQPGFDPAATLLIVDEAHNLPARVADAYSHALRSGDAWTTYDALRAARAPAAFVLAWEAWARELDDLRPCESLDGATEIGLRAAAARLAELVPATALDFVALGPRVSELLWQLPQLDEFLDAADLPKLLWCPARGELRVTCLDAANAIAETLRRFRHVVLTSATLNPPDAFALACGLDRPPPREQAPRSAEPPAVDLAATLGRIPRAARKTLRGLTTGSALLRVEEEQTALPVPFLRADTPWRSGAYRVAIDTRVDTRWERRTHHFETTAATIAQLCAAARPQPPSHPPAPSEATSSPSIVQVPNLPPSTFPPATSVLRPAADPPDRGEGGQRPTLNPSPRCGPTGPQQGRPQADPDSSEPSTQPRTYRTAAREATGRPSVLRPAADPPDRGEGGHRPTLSPPSSQPSTFHLPTCHDSPPSPAPIAVFFPSYAYADAVAATCAASHPALRIVQQPRGLDLAAQTAFLEASLISSDAIFLVLGTGYTEGIDLLGGRITHAMVVGPALPEVNAVQRAKLAQCTAKSRDAAFRLVYQVPGMQKVNQALGRLVRAPGHHATVLLHCRRFAEKSYRDLLDPELQSAPVLDSDELLAAWLAGHEITA